MFLKSRHDKHRRIIGKSRRRFRRNGIGFIMERVTERAEKSSSIEDDRGFFASNNFMFNL